VADTKRKFVQGYAFPLPALYSTVLQELLVSQHLTRHNTNYVYSAVRGPSHAAAAQALRSAALRSQAPSQVSALGFCSVFDQLMDGFPSQENKELIFKCACGCGCGCRVDGSRSLSHFLAHCRPFRLPGRS
jgi:hypothetical protein